MTALARKATDDKEESVIRAVGHASRGLRRSTWEDGDWASASGLGAAETLWVETVGLGRKHVAAATGGGGGSSVFPMLEGLGGGCFSLSWSAIHKPRLLSLQRLVASRSKYAGLSTSVQCVLFPVCACLRPPSQSPWALIENTAGQQRTSVQPACQPPPRDPHVPIRAVPPNRVHGAGGHCSDREQHWRRVCPPTNRYSLAGAPHAPDRHARSSHRRIQPASAGVTPDRADPGDRDGEA